jgi:hypothetical protein
LPILREAATFTAVSRPLTRRFAVFVGENLAWQRERVVLFETTILA